MKDLFSSIYLAAKVAAALLNAGSVILFVRLAGDATFGEYLIGFAYAFIAFSFATQWLLNAHFARQSPARAEAVGLAAAATALATLPFGLVILIGCAAAGLVPAALVGPAALLVIGLTVFYTLSELGRSQLLVGPTALSAFLRSLFTLAFGTGALLAGGGAGALMTAVALAHLAAAIPPALRLRKRFAGKSLRIDRAEIAGLWRYGAPLIFAAGAGALALMVDRLLLDRALGPGAVGPYGAVLDFTKQSFIIVGEAVTISYVSQAKALYGDGEDEASRLMRAKAGTTIALLAVFGTAFFTLFGADLFAVLFDLDAASLHAPVLWLGVGNAFLLMRAYYFGQVIYFTGSVRSEIHATLVALGLGFALGAILIPAYGVVGAAASFALTQGGALAAFLLARATREMMPVETRRAGLVVVCGLGVTALGLMLRQWPGGGAATALSLLAMSAVSAVLVLKLDAFDAQTLKAKLFAKAGAPR